MEQDGILVGIRACGAERVAAAGCLHVKVPGLTGGAEKVLYADFLPHRARSSRPVEGLALSGTVEKVSYVQAGADCST